MHLTPAWVRTPAHYSPALMARTVASGSQIVPRGDLGKQQQQQQRSETEPGMFVGAGSQQKLPGFWVFPEVISPRCRCGDAQLSLGDWQPAWIRQLSFFSYGAPIKVGGGTLAVWLSG